MATIQIGPEQSEETTLTRSRASSSVLKGEHSSVPRLGTRSAGVRQIRRLNSGETSAVAILGLYPAAPWHRLYFLPDPQGQIAFRLTTGTEPVELVRFGCGGDVAPRVPGPGKADGASN